LNAGPNAVVGNIYHTVVSDFSACALCAGGSGWAGLSGTSADYVTTFIGNWVYGGRSGEACTSSTPPSFVLNFSGNYLSLYPPFNEYGDAPGAAVAVGGCRSVNVCGNTLAAGGYGLRFDVSCTNALVLMNDFGAAARGGIGYIYGGAELLNASVLRNTFNEGVTFHVQLPYPDNFGWFLEGNTYLNGSASVPVFVDPAASSAHVSN
jgi:hypothetical protein